MDPNLTIDQSGARRLLEILDLEKEAKEEDIKWALSIIHQIPGYGKISLAKASQDTALRKVLVGIAREEIAPTIPRDMEALLKQAKERQRLKEAAKEKGEKETQEFVEAAEKAAKARPKEAPAPIAGPAPVLTGAPTAAVPPPGGGTGFSIIIGKPPKVGAPVSLEKGIKNSVAAATLAPLQLAGSMASQVLSRENPGLLTNIELTRRGATSGKLAPLKTQALAAGMSSSQFDSLLKNLATLPTGRFSRAISGFKSYGELSEFIYKGELSISAGYVPGAVYLTPSVDGNLVFHSPSVVGGLVSQAAQRLFGRVAARAVNALIGGGAKAAVGVAAKAAVGKAAGAGIGALLGSIAPGIGNAIGAIGGWISTNILGKLLSFFREHKEAVFATVLLGLGVLIGGPVGLGFFALGGLMGLGALAGGTEAGIQAAGGFGGTILYGITHVVLASIAVPLAISLITIPVLVAFIYYVITTGAFVAPKQIGTGPSFNLPFSLTGPLPSGAPSGWPVTGPVIQGPNTVYTHAGAQAVDIIDKVGTPVTSTDPGVASVYDFGPFGKHVEVQTTINGQAYITRYAHLSAITVANGQTVNAGDVIGLTGNTGNSDTPHLHYEFKGLPMNPPFIPKAVPEGCLGIDSCNIVAS